MMRKIHKSILSMVTALIVLTALCLLLTACSCRHQWKDTPNAHSQTCARCGEIQPKDEACKWVDAACEAPKTCSVCKKTEGEALGHTWVDATTEAPKTCSVCQKTEGERIITDSRFTTAACKDLFGEWKGASCLTGAQLGYADFTGTMGVTYTLIFNPDGTYSADITQSDKAAFMQDFEIYYMNAIYAAHANMGLDKEQADAFMAQSGTDAKTQAAQFAAFLSASWDIQLANDASSGVYYVSGGKLYSGPGWSEPIGGDNYTLVDGKLTLESLTQTFPGLEFSPVTQ